MTVTSHGTDPEWEVPPPNPEPITLQVQSARHVLAETDDEQPPPAPDDTQPQNEEDQDQ